MPVATPFGRYELYDRIAVGGMAELFLARAHGEGGFQKTCVIKRVLPHLARESDFVRMFLDEARIVATLNHPGIVQIFELGKVDDSYFIAMEYLAGEDLSSASRRCVERGEAFPLRLAVHIIARAAEALHHAHQASGPNGEPLNVVHRDVSPSNILVTYQGVVKVLDFGIARAEQRLQQTDVGTVKGKAMYMSPEQSRGQAVDRRSDVWALGVCLHELLTGRRIFEAESVLETSLRVIELPIPAPSSERGDTPPRLDALLLRCLERDPGRRTPDAESLRAQLDALLITLGGPVTPTEVSQWLRTTFGEARADGRAHPLLSIRSGGTESLEAKTESSHTDPTVSEARRKPRRAAAIFVVAASALALVATAATAVLLQRPTPPGSVPTPMLQREGRPTQPTAAAVPPVVAPTNPQPVEVGDSEAVEDTRASHDAAAVTTRSGDVAADEGKPTMHDEAAAPVQPATKRRTQQRPKATRTIASRSAPAPRARVSLSANVPVVAWLGTKRLGALPLAGVEVPAGKVRIRLENRALGIARTLTLTLAAGGVAQEQVTFGQGTVNVLVDPWADVFIDGERVGQTPLAGRVLWEGRHRIRLVNPDGEKQLTVNVRAGETVVVRETLP